MMTAKELGMGMGNTWQVPVELVGDGGQRNQQNGPKSAPKWAQIHTESHSRLPKVSHTFLGWTPLPKKRGIGGWGWGWGGVLLGVYPVCPSL